MHLVIADGAILKLFLVQIG